ncbi:hypothetical protein [Azospirillum agricola]|uniref:hypothetical protein n=1 Tax=Azospirillum agricola TaxID=1720247 RepID=UPI0011788EA2|nr:hypothetical protein [Azospirillum agricola]
MTHAALSGICSNIGLHGQFDPSLSKIANLASHILEKYTKDYMKNKAGFPKCEISIFGCCPNSERLESYYISNTQGGGGKAYVRRDMNPIFMGDGSETHRNKWNSLVEAGSSPGGNTPIIALEEIISRESRKTVGGATQFVHCDKNGFHILQTEFGAPIVGTQSYLGFDICGQIEPILGAVVAMDTILTKTTT